MIDSQHRTLFYPTARKQRGAAAILHHATVIISLDPEDTGAVYPEAELLETLQACTGLTRGALTRPVPIGTLVQPLGDDNERRVDYYASLVEHANSDSASVIDS